MLDLQGKAVNLCSSLTLLWQYQVKLFSKFNGITWFMMRLLALGSQYSTFATFQSKLHFSELLPFSATQTLSGPG